MELNSSFAVHAPVERVWATLMDIERVAGCLPGAEILGKVSEDAYRLGVKVKLGPVTMAYRGNLDVAERDELHHRAVLSGQAKETRGQGTARATATMTLTEAAGLTTGVIHTDLALSGRAAAMGKSVIGTVSEQLMKQFAGNLQAMIDVPEAAALAGQSPIEVQYAPQALPPAAEDSPAPTAPGHAPEDNSLNGLALAGQVALGQLSDPRKLGALLVLTALVAYLLGRRSGGSRP